MKQYALNISFTNGTIICVKLPKGKSMEDCIEAIEEEQLIYDEHGNCYSISFTNMNYYTIYELRDSEVEEETPAHTEA